MAFEKGTHGVKIVGGVLNFYEEYAATNLYVERSFGGETGTVTVSNESTTDTVSLSYDGATVEAELYPEESLTLHVAKQSSVYIKGDAGGDNVRIWAW